MMPEKVVNVRSTHTATYDGLSRYDLLAWVNATLKVDFLKVDDLCTGAAYCQLMHSLFPNYIPMRRVKLFTNVEHDFFDNFKMLQTSFQKLGVQKTIPIDRLCKGRFQDNIEFLQWFKKFYEANMKKDKFYDPVAARNGEPMGHGLKGSKRHSDKRSKVIQSSRGKETYRSEEPIFKDKQLELTLTRSLTQVQFKDDSIPDSPVEAFKDNVESGGSDIDQTSDVCIKPDEEDFELSPKKEENLEVSHNEIDELREKLNEMDCEMREVRDKLVSVQKTRDKFYVKLKEIGFCIKEAEDAGKTSVETLKITNILLGSPEKTIVGDTLKEKESLSE